MERPGLLELAGYALVIAIAAGWVYALPPFTHDPGKARSARGSPAGTATSSRSGGSERDGTVAEVGSQDNAAAVGSPAPAPQAVAPRPNLLVVTANSLNMRSEPDARSALVGSYPRGALVEQVEVRGNWVRVRTVADNSTGWMYATYLGVANAN